MGRSKSYTVAGRSFTTQGALESETRRALNSHPMNVEFLDPFLMAVVNELHHEVIAAGQRVVRFRYLDFAEQQRQGRDTAERFRGGNLLEGFFEPINEWRDVTVYPWRRPSAEIEVKIALREKAAAFIPHPTDSDRCAIDGCDATGSALEYDHVAPTFDQMARECIGRCTTQEEVETRFGYSKFSPSRPVTVADCIPSDHPCVAMLREMHARNEWRWVCARHHRNVK